jgi:hypothetical protein
MIQELFTNHREVCKIEEEAAVMGTTIQILGRLPVASRGRYDALSTRFDEIRYSKWAGGDYR